MKVPGPKLMCTDCSYIYLDIVANNDGCPKCRSEFCVEVDPDTELPDDAIIDIPSITEEDDAYTSKTDFSKMSISMITEDDPERVSHGIEEPIEFLNEDIAKRRDILANRDPVAIVSQDDKLTSETEGVVVNVPLIAENDTKEHSKHRLDPENYPTAAKVAEQSSQDRKERARLRKLEREARKRAEAGLPPLEEEGMDLAQGSSGPVSGSEVEEAAQVEKPAVAEKSDVAEKSADTEKTGGDSGNPEGLDSRALAREERRRAREAAKAARAAAEAIDTPTPSDSDVVKEEDGGSKSRRPVIAEEEVRPKSRRPEMEEEDVRPKSRRPVIAEEEVLPKSRRPVMEEEEVRPKSRRPEMEEVRPKSRRPVMEEEEVRPKSRRPEMEDGSSKSRRPVMEEEEVRPKSRRPVMAEEEERPKSRRPVMEEEEERPKSRRPVMAEEEERPKSRRPVMAEEVPVRKKPRPPVMDEVDEDYEDEVYQEEIVEEPVAPVSRFSRKERLQSIETAASGAVDKKSGFGKKSKSETVTEPKAKKEKPDKKEKLDKKEKSRFGKKSPTEEELPVAPIRTKRFTNAPPVAKPVMEDEFDEYEDVPVASSSSSGEGSRFSRRSREVAPPPEPKKKGLFGKK